ncbi:MAG: zinc ABC transporter substrate-binding protein [Tannerella sp.]|nr:zinc ABC transporter substrate-binding protein [Tannerella sp.]
MNLPFYIARRYLFAKKSQNVINIISLVSLCGVIVATVAMICTLSVYNGFKDMTTILFSIFDPELKITPVEGKVFDPETPDVEQVCGLSEIELYSKVLQENSLVKYLDRQDIAIVKGVDSVFHRIAHIDTAIIDGAFRLKEGDTKYAILGVATSLSLGVNAASVYQIEIYMPKRTEHLTASSFNVEYAQIGGIYHTNQVTYDEGFMIVPIEMMRSMLDYEKEVSAIEIKTKPGTDISALKGKIKSILGSNFFVKDRYEQQETSFNMVQMEKWITYLMLCFLLILALFNLVGSISILMIEKKDDIGKLQSMGANNRFTNNIFLFEGWMITIIGAIIGVIVGLALCLLQKYFGVVKLGQTAGTFIIDAYPVKVEILDIVIIFITVIFIGFLAALYPVHFLGKKMLEKKAAILLITSLFIASCTIKKDNSDPEIAVTIEPERYFAEKIAGNSIRFFSVVPVGQGPETYDPTPQEMIRVGKSKAFFKIGQLGIEDIIVKSLQQNNPEIQVFDMSADMFDTQDARHNMQDETNRHIGADPHIWSSIQGAKTISKNIYNAVILLDKANKSAFESNYNKLSEEIDELEKYLHKQLDTVKCRCFVIYHPALSYFAKEFDFKQLSIEEEGKEPSPATLKHIIEEAKTANTKVVFVQKEFNRKYAEQIANEIDARIIEIDLLDYQWEKQILKISKALATNGETD